jgi:hypothetical protein
VTGANFHHAVNVCEILAFMFIQIVANRHSYLRSQVFWDVLCCQVSGSQDFEET